LINIFTACKGRFGLNPESPQLANSSIGDGAPNRKWVAMNSKNQFYEKNIIRINNDEIKVDKDILILEKSYELWVNSHPAGEFNCTPKDIKDIKKLAAGHLYFRDMIHSYEDIKGIEVDEQKQIINVHTGSMTPPPKKVEQANFRLEIKQIQNLMNDFNNRCRMFQMTGASHAIAIADSREILYMEEDVSRLNALEKIIGTVLIKKVDAADKVLIFSGRVSIEMIKRAQKIQIKMLLAVGAPTSSAVELAEASGITLCGFVRNDCLNLYTCPERVIITDC
jgi:FdhD protein